MQKLFFEVGSLDRLCYDEYVLTEDILMEHAANAMAEFIKSRFAKNSKILIACGGGNNGADGVALGRILHGDFEVLLLLPFGAKSEMCRLQLKRAQKVGVKIISEIEGADVVVDALFGSGLKNHLDKESDKIINELNGLKAHKIACDIPSGIDLNGTLQGEVFRADTTITMGALKVALFSDYAKDFIGEIIIADLGLSRTVYEKNSELFLLEVGDLKLPKRSMKNSHKGTYGHLAVIIGEKDGAGVLCATSALSFGVGLVTCVSNEKIKISPELMQDRALPKNTTAIALGMGLGEKLPKEVLKAAKEVPCVIDADMFYKKEILEILASAKSVVLTPHPKEFSSLLEICDFGKFEILDIQNRRFELSLEFSKKYPHTVLLLKGANTIIAQDGRLYVNPHGSIALAKGGSGDVLAGLIGALLAQNYEPLEATIQASLAHALASQKFKNNYALTPLELIKNIKCL